MLHSVIINPKKNYKKGFFYFFETKSESGYVFILSSEFLVFFTQLTEIQAEKKFNKYIEGLMLLLYVIQLQLRPSFS